MADPPTARGDTAAGVRQRVARLSVLPRILGLLRPYQWRLWLAMLLLLAGSGVSLAYPQAARYAVDWGMSGGSLARLDTVALIFCALLVAQAGLIWVRHYLMSWLGQRAVTDLRQRVYDHLLALHVGWYHERHSGELVGRLAADVATLQGVVGSDLSFALRSVVQFLGGVTLLFITNAELMLVTLAIVPAVALGGVFFGRMVQRLSRSVQDELAAASAQVQETVGAIQTVQAFVREPRERARYREGVEGAFRAALRLARWRATFFSTVSMAGYVAIATLIYLGGRQVIAGELSAGELVSFLLYTGIVATSLVSMANTWSALQRAAGATARLFEILDTAPAIRDPDRPLPLQDRGGEVRFEGVTFRYPSAPDRAALRDVSFEIGRGEVVALVGPSGGGKTTLAALLMRFHDVSEGRVMFEGRDVREVRLDALRGAIALVSQEPVLFAGSVGENIAYGRPEASEAQLRQAAREAHADEFIRALPQGYDTQVGERGVKLSGGQRQRIAIARALLRDPRLLILDEATSSLDAESEALVQQALTRLMRGRTTLVIAHRLSTVRDADRIVVIDRGRVSEQGTHAALMAQSGTYRRLVEHQLIERSARAASP